MRSASTRTPATIATASTTDHGPTTPRNWSASASAARLVPPTLIQYPIVRPMNTDVATSHSWMRMRPARMNSTPAGGGEAASSTPMPRSPAAPSRRPCRYSRFCCDQRPSMRCPATRENATSTTRPRVVPSAPIRMASHRRRSNSTTMYATTTHDGNSGKGTIANPAVTRKRMR